MYDLGTTHAHSNELDFGNIPVLQFASGDSFSVFCKFWMSSAATGNGSNKTVFGQYEITGSISGWALRSESVDPPNQLRLLIGNGGSTDSFLTPAFATDTVESIGVTLNDTSNDAVGYLKGATKIEDTLAIALAANTTTPFVIGDDAATTALGCRVAHVMIWDKELTQAEVDLYHSGEIIPAYENLVFWTPGVSLTEGDLISGLPATNDNVTITTDAVDNLFSGSGIVSPARNRGGRQLRLFRIAPEIYTMEVPLEYLDFELGDCVGLAHNTIPKPATIINAIESNFMLEPWMRLFAHLVESKINMDKQTLELKFINSEPYIVQAWQTNIIKNAPVGSAKGRAELYYSEPTYGLSKTIDRTSTHYIEDTSGQTTGSTKLAEVAPFSLKTNHKGTYYEEAYTNLVKNSAFLEDGAGPPTFLDTTETTGTGGTITALTDMTTIVPGSLFRSAKIQGLDVQHPKLTYGSAGDCYLEWGSITTAASPDLMRLSFWAYNRSGVWQIQRSSDSNYWVDSTASWSASVTWNAFTFTGSDWTRYHSDVITGIDSDTLTLKIGHASGHSPSGDIYLGQVQLTQNWPIYTDVITTNSTTTLSVVDKDLGEMDNGGIVAHQAFYPPRGTFRARLQFTTDTADIPNNTVLTIGWWGVDASNDYDVCALQRTAGGTLRLVFARYEGGSNTATATLNIADQTIGNEIEVAARWIEADGDLGLTDFTMSIFGDGTKGTDDQANDTHSDTDQTTFIQIGGSSLSGFDSSEAFTVYDIEMVQRALADEEILGRRLLS